MPLQSLQGGSPVMIAGTDLPLWGMEIDPEKAKASFRASAAADNGKVHGHLLHPWATNAKVIVCRACMQQSPVTPIMHGHGSKMMSQHAMHDADASCAAN